MYKLNRACMILLIVFVAVSPAASQTPTWQSLDGPYKGTISTMAYSDALNEVWIDVSGRTYRRTVGSSDWRPANTDPSGTVVQGPLAFGPQGVIFAGRHHSADGGGTWQEGNLPDSVVVEMIAYDSVSDVVVIAGDTGAWRSNDGGLSWQLIDLPSFDRLGSPVAGAIYATIERNTKLLVSIDGAQTWTEAVIPVPVNNLTPPLVSGTLMTTAYDPATRQSVLLNSIDDGLSWAIVSSMPSACSGTQLIGTDLQGRVLSRSSSRLLRIDVGGTCEVLLDRSRYTFPGGLTTSIRWDGPTAATVDSEGTIYIVDRWGIVERSNDSGATWTVEPYRNLSGTQYSSLEFLAVDPISGDLLVGTGADGAFIYESGSASWRGLGFRGPGLRGVRLGPAPSEIWIGTLLNGLFRSMDDGESWSFVPNYELHRSSGVMKLYGILPVFSDGAIVVNWRETDLWQTTDGGVTWDALGLPDYPGCETKLIDAVKGPGEAITATLEVENSCSRFEVIRSIDRGATWEVVGEPFQQWLEAVLHDSRGRTWVSVYGLGIFVQEGDTAPWTHTLALIGNESALDLLETPNGDVFAATLTGVRRTTDSGSTWQALDNGLPETCVELLAWDPIRQAILAATCKKGVYRLDWPVGVNTESLPSAAFKIGDLDAFPNPFRSTLTIRPALSVSVIERIEIFDTLGRRVYRSRDSDQPVDATRFAAGVYLIRAYFPGGVATRTVVKIF